MINYNHRGQSLIGIIIVLITVGLISGGLYYYLSRQITEIPEITEKPVEEKVVEPEEEIIPSPEEGLEKGLTEEGITPPEEVVPGEKIVPTCQNKCSQNGLKKCSNNGYQTCGDYDADACLEWSSITNCPANTICQNGICIQQKCADGTLYGQCSTNKPKYCDNGNLINRASLCGCPLDYEVYGDQCTKKLAKNCGVIYGGTQDYAKAINFVIVPADLLYGTHINDPNAQYSNNLDVFILDAERNVNDFLSVDPVNKYKNIFNFYYSTNVIKCILPNGTVECNLWKESADSCNIPYDEVIILQRKEGGGLWGWGIQSSAHTTITFVHEIGHYLGFQDYDWLWLPVGPNHCSSLDCCGGTVCQFQHWSEQKPIELGGPDCCLYKGVVNNTSFYIPNEQSAMHIGIDYKALKFNRLERTYLNELFSKISSMGKESVRCGVFFRTAKYCQ